MWVAIQLMVAIDFQRMKKKKSIATVDCLVTHVLQNIIFCAQNKKETHTGLEGHEDE